MNVIIKRKRISVSICQRKTFVDLEGNHLLKTVIQWYARTITADNLVSWVKFAYKIGQTENLSFL